MSGSDSPRARAQQIVSVLEVPASRQALDWLVSSLPAEQSGFARGTFFAAFAGAGRRFGEAVPMLSTTEQARLRAIGIASPERWTLSELARAALLLCAVASLPESEHLALLTEAFRKGESAERVAVLRALALLPDPARFVELAVDACRSHVLQILAAVACDNPYPATHFPQLNFNQLLMKVLFVELPLERVLDWRKRCDTELFRMARDYEAERRAAGRPVPADLTVLRSLELTP